MSEQEPSVRQSALSIGFMCLIAVSDSRFSELSPEFWAQACRANPHGFGLMWHDGHQLQTRTRASISPEALADEVDALPRGCRIALHLREATMGARSLLNAHPFRLTLDEARFSLAVMHNGSIPALRAQGDRGPSDSALLVSHWLKPRIAQHPYAWRLVMDELNQFLPERNRLVFLDNAGHWHFVRRHEGFVVGGTWLSHPRSRAWLPARERAQRDLFD